MLSPLARTCLAVVSGVLVLAPYALGVNILDSDGTDSLDPQYQALGANSLYQAAGAFSGGSFGGTLIADPFGLDRYVITATHLVQAGQINLSSTFTIGGNSYNVASIVSAPNYNPATQENDLSIIRLATSVTGVTPVPYYTGNLALGQTVTFIGYGFSGTGLTGGVTNDGLRRGANNVIDVLDASTVSSGLPSTSYLLDFDNPSGTSNSLSLVNTDGQANSSPIPVALEGGFGLGDSGGGEFAMIDGTLYLVGVNSYVATPDGNPDAQPAQGGQGKPLGFYGDIDGATRVSDFQSFIAQNVPEPGSATLLLAGAFALASRRPRGKGSGS